MTNFRDMMPEEIQLGHNIYEDGEERPSALFDNVGLVDRGVRRLLKKPGVRVRSIKRTRDGRCKRCRKPVHKGEESITLIHGKYKDGGIYWPFHRECWRLTI